VVRPTMSAANLYKASFEQDALTTACSLMTRSVFVFMYSFIHVYDFLWAAVHDLDRDLVTSFQPSRSSGCPLASALLSRRMNE